MQLEKTDLLALIKWTNLTTTTISQSLCVQSYSESRGSRMDPEHCGVALSGCPERAHAWTTCPTANLGRQLA